MNSIGKIVGFPLKLLANNRIYIPKEYLRYYGISEKKDSLLISQSMHSIFYRPMPTNEIEYPRKKIVSIRIGLTAIPMDWVRKNNLNRGDTLFLLGTTSDLPLYIKKNNNL